VVVGILVNNSRLSDFRAHMSEQLSELRAHIDVRFEAAHQELLRVEGVLAARLTNVEARLSQVLNRFGNQSYVGVEHARPFCEWAEIMPIIGRVEHARPLHRLAP
jgi:hypothetical protein